MQGQKLLWNRWKLLWSPLQLVYTRDREWRDAVPGLPESGPCIGELVLTLWPHYRAGAHKIYLACSHPQRWCVRGMWVSSQSGAMSMGGGGSCAARLIFLWVSGSCPKKVPHPWFIQLLCLTELQRHRAKVTMSTGKSSKVDLCGPVCALSLLVSIPAGWTQCP